MANYQLVFFSDLQLTLETSPDDNNKENKGLQ